MYFIRILKTMSTNNIPNNFVAKTSFGSFQVKITNRDYIIIGSQHKCVQIAYNYKTNIANLDWIQAARGGCEVSGKNIRGINTVAMADLGFTILRQLYPSVEPILHLRDSSKFACRLPDDTSVSVSSMTYHLLLYGKTYYQDRFHATLLYPESEPAYRAFVEARKNPKYFNKNYDFRNDDLNDAFKTLRESSNNWGEFFEQLKHKYNDNTCTLMYSWCMDVFSMLAKVPIHTDWVIDMNTRPMIDYTITSRNNSTNYTRKSYEYSPHIYGGGYFPTLMSYRSILRGTTCSRGTTIKGKKKLKSYHTE